MFSQLTSAFILTVLLAAFAKGYKIDKGGIRSTNKTYTADEWAQVMERIRPKNIIDPNYKPIVQPAGSGMRSARDVDPFVIGGTPAKLGDFPWHALILADGTAMCGGSLILENWVLTAASCVDGHKSFQIDLGSIDRLQMGAVRLTSTNFTIHPDYNKVAKTNNIALIKLPQNVVMTANIKTVALQAIDAVPLPNFEGPATLSGMGQITQGVSTNLLQTADLTVIPLATCVASFDFIFDTNICTKIAAKAACIIDEGSPLVFKDGAVFKQIGVYSYTDNTDCLAKPSVYSRVTSYQVWMSNVIGKDVTGTTTTTTTTSTTTTTTTSTTTTGPTTTKSTSTSTSTSTTSTKATTVFVPRPQQGVTCKHQHFENMKKCCNTRHGDLFPVFKGDFSSAGCSGNTASFKIFNSYYLNKGQNPRSSNALSFSDPQLGKFFAKDACFVNCYLAAKGAMFPNGTINEEGLINAMLPNQKVRWAATFNASVSSCKAVISKQTIPTFSNGRFSCPGSAAMFMQCIQLKMHAACSNFDSKPSCVKVRGSFFTCSEPVAQALTGTTGVAFSAGRLLDTMNNEYEDVPEY